MTQTFDRAAHNATSGFFHACNELAHAYFAQFGRTEDALLVKERELIALKADLAEARAGIAELESSLASLAAEKRAEAYGRLFNLAGLRSELEEQVWNMECTLSMLKAPSFA